MSYHASHASHDSHDYDFATLIEKIKSYDFNCFYELQLQLLYNTDSSYDDFILLFLELITFISRVIYKVNEVFNQNKSIIYLDHYKRIHIGTIKNIQTLCMSGEITQDNFNHENIMKCFEINYAITNKFWLLPDHLKQVSSFTNDLFDEIFPKPHTLYLPPVIV